MIKKEATATAAAHRGAVVCFSKANAAKATSTVTAKFFTAALNPETREITPWIMPRWATLRLTKSEYEGRPFCTNGIVALFEWRSSGLGRKTVDL